MRELDPARVRDFDRAIQPHLNQYGSLYKKRKLKKIAQLMGDQATLVLLRRRRICQGQQQILDFWNEMRDAGLVSVHFYVKRKVSKPADFLQAEVRRNGAYVAYDIEHYALGTYEFVFQRKKGNPRNVAKTGSLLVVEAHPITCQREDSMFVLEY
jgi:hypothetical protein